MAVSRITALAAALSLVFSVAANNGTNSSCRFLPTDSAWPTESRWAKLNQTVGGRLIRGVPLAQVCYGPNIDAAKCAEITEDWSFQVPYYTDPVNIMDPYWQNNSCSPFLAPNGTCKQGNLAQYAINVSDASTVIAGIKFAQQNNIRLTIKNTGHDLLGRSAGEGSLALWTHNLKSWEFNSSYSSANYTGAAVKVGAGVQVLETYEKAAAAGYRVVGGGCPTVGLAGGWLPGGGHGPLTSAYGLGADNALEFEVVTMDGSHLIATPTQNSDLYWALSGGGPSTYAVVLSITLKAHADGPVAGSTWAFLNTNDDAFWAAVQIWTRYSLVLEEQFPKLKAGGEVGGGFFSGLATYPDATAAELNAALKPYFDELESLNITLALNSTVLSPSFLDSYNEFPATYTNNQTVGDRLIPRELVADDSRLTTFVDTMRNITLTDSSAVFVFVQVNVSNARVGNEPSSNSVLPAWRDTAFLLNFGVTESGNLSTPGLVSNLALVNEWEDIFRALTPGGGSYINEATWNNVNWKTDYYGVNYDRLLSIKNKYDPNNTLWANAAVGSDALFAASDGRLCQSSSSSSSS